MKISVFTLCPILDYFDKIEDTDNKINANYFRNNVFSIPLFASTELDEIKNQIANYEQMEGVESSMSFTRLDARNVLVICKRYDTIINVYKIREFVVWNIRGLQIKPHVTPKDEDNGEKKNYLAFVDWQTYNQVYSIRVKTDIVIIDVKT